MSAVLCPEPEEFSDLWAELSAEPLMERLQAHMNELEAEEVLASLITG